VPLEGCTLPYGLYLASVPAICTNCSLQISEDRASSNGSPCVIFGGKICNGTGFTASTFVFHIGPTFQTSAAVCRSYRKKTWAKPGNHPQKKNVIFLTVPSVHCEMVNKTHGVMDCVFV
jgi:hypothetical protein